MQSKKFLASLAVMSVSVSLASCGGTENLGPDGRYGSADAAPAVLVRDLDVYRLIGNEEYVRIPLSDDLSESNAQKFFTATAENLHFDVAAYYRNGSIYYKITSSIRRDEEGNLVSADANAIESAVDKTQSLFFRLGFQTEMDGRNVTMPVTGITVFPRDYTRLQGGRNASGREQIMLEYVGVLADVPPSMFSRLNALDVTWVDAEVAADAAVDAAAPVYEAPEAAPAKYAPYAY
jgi:hypothetical protein